MVNHSGRACSSGLVTSLSQWCTNVFSQELQTEFSKPTGHTPVKIKIVPQFYERQKGRHCIKIHAEKNSYKITSFKSKFLEKLHSVKVGVTDDVACLLPA